jgi:hypothetical protein
LRIHSDFTTVSLVSGALHPYELGSENPAIYSRT